MQHLEQLNAFYKNEGEEELRLQENGPQYLEFLTAVKYMEKFLPPNSKILDSCAGSGVYSFYLAKRGHAVTAGDIVPYNVNVISQKEKENRMLTVIYRGDARDLSRFADGSFDAVLCMGAFYHLHKEEERRRVVNESLRVLADNGLFFGTYMNRYAVILQNCKANLANIDEILRFAKDGREGIFYASTPEETERLMSSCGLKKLCHVALDGMGVFLYKTANLIDEEGLSKWREYHFAVCEEESLLGCGYHNMFIGRRSARRR